MRTPPFTGFQGLRLDIDSKGLLQQILDSTLLDTTCIWQLDTLSFQNPEQLNLHTTSNSDEILGHMICFGFRLMLNVCFTSTLLGNGVWDWVRQWTRRRHGDDAALLMHDGNYSSPARCTARSPEQEQSRSPSPFLNTFPARETTSQAA